MYSSMTQQYYFVPKAQTSLMDPTLHQVIGSKTNVTDSVRPLVAHAVAGHLRELARTSAFDAKGRRKLLAAARSVEKNAGIDAADHEG